MKTRLLVLTLFVGALVLVLRLQAHDEAHDGLRLQAHVTHVPRGFRVEPSFKQGVSVDDPDREAKLKLQSQLSPGMQAMLDESTAERYRYKGTNIGGRGHDDIANRFNKLDPLPQERRAYFDWCISTLEHPLTGWYGYIKSVTQTDDGALVEIFIAPHFQSDTTTGDHYIETWRYKNKQFTFVSGAGQYKGRWVRNP